MWSGATICKYMFSVNMKSMPFLDAGRLVWFYPRVSGSLWSWVSSSKLLLAPRKSTGNLRTVPWLQSSRGRRIFHWLWILAPSNAWKQHLRDLWHPNVLAPVSSLFRLHILYLCNMFYHMFCLCYYILIHWSSFNLLIFIITPSSCLLGFHFTHL